MLLEMKKITVLLGVVLLVGLGYLFAFAQSEEAPGFNFPSLDTATETITATAQISATPTTQYITVTPTRIVTQTVTDDVETGPEIYILIGLSLVGGLGVFLIKKYFDLKKYEL